jgi:hypothetical protein
MTAPTLHRARWLRPQPYRKVWSTDDFDPIAVADCPQIAELLNQVPVHGDVLGDSPEFIPLDVAVSLPCWGEA